MILLARLLDRRPVPPGSTPTALGSGAVLWLTDPAAIDGTLVGAKAAALARAAALGMPVLPGVVLTTTARGLDLETVHALHTAWKAMSDGGRVPVVVRSSSTNEDGEESSMAGLFTSVLDVRGWPAVLDAVDMVLRSADQNPMAVLVQPMLDAAVGGVLFGLDPVTGRTDRLLVESVPGGPSALVSGLVSGTRHLLTSRGRLLETDDPRGSRSLSRAQRHALAHLADAAHHAFGGPQDIEWAFDQAGRLWLFQSRPVTATAATAQLVGPVLGPGPIAETLPDAVTELEEDLWVEPIRSGIATALAVVGATPKRVLRRSPIVVTVGGRVAADLGVLGVTVDKPSFLRRFDPRPPARRLAAAWRVGRLRRAIDSLAGDVLDHVDTELGGVPKLSTLGDDTLLDLLHGGRRALLSVHGHEVLAGILGADVGASTASVALASVRRGRASGLSDAEIVAQEPVVLALTVPAIGAVPSLPHAAHIPGEARTIHDLSAREALRLRARWLQELTALAAAELGHRLASAGVLATPELVRSLRLAELDDAVRDRVVPDDLVARSERVPAPPLPAAFRLTVAGEPVAVRHGGERRLGGRGAGGGRAVGTVWEVGAETPSNGAVLVVRSLEPSLAGVLPGLAGLVAETGSVLSHLAILARELGIPTVVGVDDAITRYPIGSTVVVDGTTGEVTLLTAEIDR